MTVDIILNELKNLSLQERRVIAEQLAVSIEQSEQEEIFQAQLTVVKERITAVKEGKSRMVDGENVRVEARKLACGTLP